MKGFGMFLGLVTAVFCLSSHLLLEASPLLNQVGATTFYQIQVRSFQDSNGDGIGDLRGLTARLDYIQWMGFNGIWLLPVFESPVFHGYMNSNYYDIRQEYGGKAAFKEFLSQAHRRGIKVIIDFVAHYTSDQHPWFIDSSSSPTSKFRDWYMWSQTDPGWVQPWGTSVPTWHRRDTNLWSYGLFERAAPGLNLLNPVVREEIIKVAKFWLMQGVDGFRLDSILCAIPRGSGPSGIQNTPETHAFWREFTRQILQFKPDAFLVGETWTTAPIIATYFQDGIPSLFNFPIRDAIVGGVFFEKSAPIQSAIQEMVVHYKDPAKASIFLTNHDMARLDTQQHGDVVKMKLASTILFTLPGIPFVYYGEEIGMKDVMAPMHWNPIGGFSTGTPWLPYGNNLSIANVVSELGDRRSMLWHYKTLIELRKRFPVLQTGSIQPVKALSASENLLYFIRMDQKGNKLLIIHNLAKVTGAIRLSDAYHLKPESPLTGVGVQISTPAPGLIEVVMPPFSSGVWKMVN